jgi:hypothetical protein
MSSRSVDSLAAIKVTRSVWWWEALTVQLRGDLTATRSRSCWEEHSGDLWVGDVGNLLGEEFT